MFIQQSFEFKRCFLVRIPCHDMVWLLFNFDKWGFSWSGCNPILWFLKRKSALHSKENRLTNRLFVLPHCQIRIKYNIIINFKPKTAAKNHIFTTAGPDGEKASKSQHVCRVALQLPSYSVSQTLFGSGPEQASRWQVLLTVPFYNRFRSLMQLHPVHIVQRIWRNKTVKWIEKRQTAVDVICRVYTFYIVLV